MAAVVIRHVMLLLVMFCHTVAMVTRPPTPGDVFVGILMA